MPKTVDGGPPHVYIFVIPVARRIERPPYGVGEKKSTCRRSAPAAGARQFFGTTTKGAAFVWGTFPIGGPRRENLAAKKLLIFEKSAKWLC